MKYRTLQGIDKPLSALTYGTTVAATRHATKGRAFKSLDLAWAAGFRTFDTAHSYGDGEEILGEWLASRGHRSEAVILDKGLNPGQKGSTDVFSGATIRRQAEESLRKLRTDHVELYILHRDDPTRPVDDIVIELNKLKDEGKILRFGGSNWTLERVLQANAFAEANGLEGFTAVSPAYSLAEYMFDPWGGSFSISGDAQAPYRAWLKETGTPVFNYSALGRGYLSGKFRTDGGKPIEECIDKAPIMEYDAPVNRARLKRAETLAGDLGHTVPQICLAWLMHEPMALFPIVSPSSEKHVNDIAAAADIALTDEQADWLLRG